MVTERICGKMPSGKEYCNASRDEAGAVGWLQKVASKNTVNVPRDIGISKTAARCRGLV